MDYLVKYRRESSAARAAGIFQIFMAAALGQAAQPTALPAAIPNLFAGQIANPMAFRNLLVGLHNVVDARYYRPDLWRYLDPVITAGSERLRLECFSSCASVYARVDFDQRAFAEANFNNEGTTNVDFGSAFLQHLTSLRPNEKANFEMGEDSIALVSSKGAAIERKVTLPSRWVKGFLQIQAVMRRAQPAFELNRVAARSLINSIKATAKETIYIVPRGNQPQLVLRPPANTTHIAVTGAHRLRLLHTICADIQTLRAFQVAETGATIWVADTGLGQMTLALSGKVEYGFSGDGEALRSLGNEPEDTSAWLARTTIAQLNNFTIEQFRECENIGMADAMTMLDYLSTQGILGYDCDEQRYFYRILPFVLDEKKLPARVKGMQSILATTRARVKVDQLQRNGNALIAAGFVEGDTGVYRVELSVDDDGYLQAGRCSCPWIKKHELKRGPCKHMLALRFYSIADQQ
jgi:hypothetical protein